MAGPQEQAGDAPAPDPLPAEELSAVGESGNAPATTGITPRQMSIVRESDRLVTINIGPHHPSTHGVLRLKTYLEGETIQHVEPIIGYLHRGVEKLFEDGSYLQAVPMTDRLDYLEAMINNTALCVAVEELADIEVPPRGRYIRTISNEINRIASHLIWLGTFCLDMGAMTMFFWAFREREGCLQLLEKLSGARLTYNWPRFGGVKNDLPPGFLRDLQKFVDYFPDRLKEYDTLLTDNDIFRARTEDVGVLTAKRAKEWSVTGPVLRASGFRYDIRREKPYDAYPDLDFEVPVGRNGDVFDRYLVRMEEMRQSLRILQQCIDNIPDGPYVSPDVGEGPKQQRLSPPEGEVYRAIESARGEMGAYIVSDGTNVPHRLKWRAPTFSNLAPLGEMVRGHKIPDLVTILGSIDIVLGDIDR